ncbi:DNA-binding response regulator [Rhodohalobacter sp. SW132]|uniref:response regulator transcription factor n=1 Tax=Rhodohalobacter sp. SW132 TaxID=2293433 RepID=UPI000E22C72A|nr:response regulator transcription factor [Rhodohalobacter sp. SW132]REL24584.1 DNA-binding response regulator [Rhodohalobacter sp. SW132]
MKKITVHIADGSEISRSGMVCLLEKSRKIDKIHTYPTANKLLKSYSCGTDSVCIISSSLSDLSLKDLMKKLQEINPSPAVIVVSGTSDIGHVNQALNCGVKGYITRQVTSNELEKTVLAVADGEQAFSRKVTKTIVTHYANKRDKPGKPMGDTITKREREVLSLIVQGLTSAEIAKRLYISPRTVETHRSNLMQKLGIKNTAGLVRYALQEGEDL